jgi:hypothetical protein
MKKITLSGKIILIYRIIFVALSWFTLIAGFFIDSISTGLPLIWLNSFKFYTIQTNFMVSLWFTLAIVWYNKPESLEKITGLLKGAFTLYITITFVLFAILYQVFYRPTGFLAFSNIILHYITPVVFIVDWVLTETKIKYKWKFLPYWTIYPLFYLISSSIYITITGDYIYPSLNLSNLGILGYLIIWFGVNTTMGSLYIAINRKRTQS